MDPWGPGQRNSLRPRTIAVNHIGLNNFRTFVNISTCRKNILINDLAIRDPTVASAGILGFVDKFRNGFSINDL